MWRASWSCRMFLWAPRGHREKRAPRDRKETPASRAPREIPATPARRDLRAKPARQVPRASRDPRVTRAVGVDADGALWTAPGSGEGGGTTPELVYSHTCDGTYVSVTDDLPLEDNKIYATFMFLPAGTADAYFYCRIGSSGNNTYTGAVSGYLYKQHSAVGKRSCVIQAKLNGGIACLSVFTPDTHGNSGVFTQDNKSFIFNKIYIYSTVSGLNLPSGLKVEVYKLN